MTTHKINRGVENEIEFKGLKGIYVYISAVGIGGSLFGGIFLTIIGVPNILSSTFAGVGAVGTTIYAFRQNKQNGRWGKDKKKAEGMYPTSIKRQNFFFDKLINKKHE